MAWKTLTGSTRSLKLNIIKKEVNDYYPETVYLLNGLSGFTFGGISYTNISVTDMAKLSHADFDKRRQDYKSFVSANYPSDISQIALSYWNNCEINGSTSSLNYTVTNILTFSGRTQDIGMSPYLCGINYDIKNSIGNDYLTNYELKHNVSSTFYTSSNRSVVKNGNSFNITQTNVYTDQILNETVYYYNYYLTTKDIPFFRGGFSQPGVFSLGSGNTSICNISSNNGNGIFIDDPLNLPVTIDNIDAGLYSLTAHTQTPEFIYTTKNSVYGAYLHGIITIENSSFFSDYYFGSDSKFKLYTATAIINGNNSGGVLWSNSGVTFSDTSMIKEYTVINPYKLQMDFYYLVSTATDLTNLSATINANKNSSDIVLFISYYGGYASNDRIVGFGDGIPLNGADFEPFYYAGSSNFNITYVLTNLKCTINYTL